MSAADVDAVMRNGGRLILNPTDLTLATNGYDPVTASFGGTELGVLGDFVFEQLFIVDKATGADDRHAGELVEAWHCGETWIMAFTLRQRSDDQKTTFYPNHLVGGTSGKKVLSDQYKGTTTKRPGTRLSARAVKLLFVPTDLTNEAILFYKAVPMLDEEQRIRLTATEEFKVAAMFQAMWDSVNNGLYAQGLLTDLSLT